MSTIRVQRTEVVISGHGGQYLQRSVVDIDQVNLNSETDTVVTNAMPLEAVHPYFSPQTMSHPAERIKEHRVYGEGFHGGAHQYRVRDVVDGELIYYDYTVVSSSLPTHDWL